MSDNNSEDETLTLGDVIELSGFKELDRGTMSIVKKVVGTYARKFSDSFNDFEKLIINLKQIHGDKKTGKGSFEIKARVIIKGEMFRSEVSAHNLFIGLDESLKKIEHQIDKD